MAILSGMSGVDLRAVCRELSGELPLWIGKIYQYSPTEFGFRLNGENKKRLLLYAAAGSRAHLVKELPPAPKNPSGYSMYLRKYVEGGKVLSIFQKGIERVLVFTIGKGPSEYNLVIEMFDEGNLILTNQAGIIQSALSQKRFRERNIVPGEQYELTAKDPCDLSFEEFKTLITEEENDIVRALAVKLKLGGVPSEEICRLSGVAKNMPCKYSDDAQLLPVYNAMKTWLSSLGTAGFIDEKGAFPFVSPAREPKERFDSFSAALEAYYPKFVAEKVLETKKKLSKEERILAQQNEALKKFERKIAEAKETSDIIYAHYSEVMETILILDAASKKMSWQDIGRVLKSSDLPAAKRIVSVDAENAAVTLDLGEKLRPVIYVHETLEANAGRYSEVVKKFRRKKEGALKAMEAGVKHAAPKKAAGPGKLKPKWYHRFRWMETTDGVLVIGGRNADQNEELVKKYMEGRDTFLHADVFGASVVLVKGHTEHMDEAVQFAASYSRMWSGGAASGNVICAQPNQVSKTPEAGEFVAHGSFIIRGERTIYKDVPLEVAIGIMTEPNLAVLGGVPSVIEGKTKVSVRLRPGTFEGNDVAKKVLRKLRDALPDAEEKALKAVLNTESVAAFVPPGGSNLIS
ncbi:MAG TPA: ribosome rescue protein RqcH [Methanocorpusculum sp.]|nr:ribosome rescue protein RqcH [Methanocorpusculum sp.]